MGHSFFFLSFLLGFRGFRLSANIDWVVILLTGLEQEDKRYICARRELLFLLSTKIVNMVVVTNSQIIIKKVDSRLELKKDKFHFWTLKKKNSTKVSKFSKAWIWPPRYSLERAEAVESNGG